MEDQLVYDVGMHNGDDTAYYLHRGFRVVSVEADPSLVKAAELRFAAEIQAGRLNIVHAGIADRSGTATFYLCEGKSEFNSFDRDNATKFGHSCRPIEIPCRTFRSILDEFGHPHFLKIDIEGFDRECVAALDRENLPQFVSCELTRTDQIHQLVATGYDSFKLVWQEHHWAVADDSRTLAAWWDHQLQSAAPLAWLAKKAASLRDRSARALARLLRSWRSLPAENPWNWTFRHGSSGPFGDDAPGEWIDAEETLFRWLALRRAKGEDYWVDIHATRAATKIQPEAKASAALKRTFAAA